MLPAAARAATIGDNAAFQAVFSVGWRTGLVVAVFLAGSVNTFAILLERTGYVSVFAQAGKGYAAYIAPRYFLFIKLIAVRNILISFGKTHYLSLIAIASAVVNLVFNYVFAFRGFGFSELGLGGIGLATTVVDLILFVLFSTLALGVL